MAAAPKTQKTKASVKDFLAAVENDQRRKDAQAVAKMMQEVTGEKPAMWGDAIVGYSSYKSSTGDWPVVAFSPRKANLVLYVMANFEGRDALLKKLGKHKASAACLYLNKLSDVDEDVLRKLIAGSMKAVRDKHAA